MGDELLITASPYGMQAAAIAGGRPVAFFIEWSASPSRIGDLHVARPLGRMKGINACVVDIGEGEEAFLQGARALDADDAPPVVQVVCDAYEGKRARVTRRPVLASRFATFRPGGSGLTFSRRLRDPEARRALAAALDGIDTSSGALTIRAAAAACPGEVPAAAAALAARWQEAEAAAKGDRTPRRLWQAGGLLGRLLRDGAAPGAATIAIDDRAAFDRATALAASEAPDLVSALSFAGVTPSETAPLFERHDCAGRLAAALEPEVVLQGGARLTVEETRTLCAIDVDTSQAANAAATETAAAAAREIVLRNLAGLIVIDFVGRRSKRRRDIQLAALERALDTDRTPHRVLGVTAGGVVEVNRQRFGPSLLQALTEPTAWRLRRAQAAAGGGGARGGRRRTARGGERRTITHAARCPGPAGGARGPR